MHKFLPGILLCAALAGLAAVLQWLEVRWLHQPLIEALVIALLLGVVWRNLFGEQVALKAGVSFTARMILEIAVLLLGGAMNLRELLAGGPKLFAAVCLALTVSLVIGAYISRRIFGLGNKPATLIAVGNSICGNSAIAAVAPIIGANAAEVASAIAFTAVIGVVVVVALPFTAAPLHLNHYQYGVFAGMGVYAVPQVLAASFSVSVESGNIATLVKLTRVLLLGPVARWFSLRQGRGGEGKRPPLSQLIPWFIAGFIGLALLRSAQVIPPALGEQLREISRWLTAAAMAALGLGVDLRALRAAGPRTVGAVLVSLLLLLAISLALIKGLGIGV
jgi:uncharacterized integral membrane protein (TIGR00698 family)